MENNTNIFWENNQGEGTTPAISPDRDKEYEKVPIEVIEGALDILRKEEEDEEGSDSEKSPTIH